MKRKALLAGASSNPSLFNVAMNARARSFAKWRPTDKPVALSNTPWGAILSKSPRPRPRLESKDRK